MTLRLASIHRYPVKSLRGEALEAAAVEPWGLAGDRRWMLVDAAGASITAREVNAMLLVRPQLTPGGLRVDADGLASLTVLVPDATRQVPVSVFASAFTAAAAGDEADAWFTRALGREARLVHLDDPIRRTVDPRFGQDDDRVSFADGYPLLMTTEESLAALNEAMLERHPGREPLSMTRFRPNVVISGAAAWAEDDWRRVRVGTPGRGVVFRAVKGCARCVMTTVDPLTGLRDKEPTATLARTRRWDGKTWFGVNLIPDVLDESRSGRSPVITVGDEVEVLEAVEPGGGPLRPRSE